MQKTKPNVQPSTEKQAVNQYDPTIKLFCNVFPWLFPGGIGDYNDYHTRPVQVKEWIERLMQYQDGRFEKDKLFCFYALNYMFRHRNQSSGHFFVRDFYGKDEVTLDDIRKEIENGNEKFIKEISYFSKHIKGSDSYWRSKKMSCIHGLLIILKKKMVLQTFSVLCLVLNIIGQIFSG